MRLWGLLRIALACLVLPAGAAAAPQMSEADKAAVRLALDRGQLIHAYDQAAWHGTDDLVAKLPDYQERVAGWIVDGPLEATELVFYDRDEEDPKAVYVARFAGARLVSSRILASEDDRSLSATRKAAIAAKNAALRALVDSGAERCGDGPMNTVVLPPQSAGGDFLIYFLSPQTNMKTIPMGGHHRVEVGPDGRARGSGKFTNSCLDVSAPDEEKELAGLAVTHLLDPVPTEIHVFSSLVARLPIYVGTNSPERLWKVEGSRIDLVPTED